MSDRCLIGFANTNNTINMVYCHWNGDPKDAGTILQKNYNSAEKVQQLIQGGFLSVLGNTPEESARIQNPTCPAETISGRREFKVRGDAGCISFLYLFANGEWLFATPYEKGWKKLAEVLANWQ